MYNSAMFFLLEWIWNNGIIFQTDTGISEKRIWLNQTMPSISYKKKIIHFSYV